MKAAAIGFASWSSHNSTKSAPAHPQRQRRGNNNYKKRITVMAHHYDYDTIRALRDVATHMSKRPNLDPPISVSLRVDHPELVVSFKSYAAWLNSAATVGTESFETSVDNATENATENVTENVTVAACAIRLGDSVYTMKAVTFLPRATAANLIGWPAPVQAV